MPKHIQYEEKELITYYQWGIYVTNVGYLVKGTGINEMHTTLVSAIIAMAEHMARNKYEIPETLESHLYNVRKMYNAILDRIQDAVLDSMIGSWNLNNEQEEIDSRGKDL